MDATVQNSSSVRFPVRDWLRVVILGGTGAYFVYNIVSGNLANYINASFVWLSYVAAGLFLLLTVTTTLRLVRGNETACDHEGCGCGDDHAHDHEHEHNHNLSWAILGTAAIPLMLGVLVPSQPLGAEAINGGVRTNAVQAAQASAFSIPPEQRNVLDWLREFNTATDYDMFGGAGDVIGFAYTEPDYPEGMFIVARFTVSCCVADASAIALPVYLGAGMEQPEQGEWVRVTGMVEAGTFLDDAAPVMWADVIEQVDVPEHPYLYP